METTQEKKRNKGGRPRKPVEELRKHINIRLHPKEILLLKQLSTQLNCTFTDAIRTLISLNHEKIK